MRGRFGLLRNSNGVVGSRVIGEAAKRVSFSVFSTSSGGGGGRGRGSSAPTKFDFVAGSGSTSPGEIGSNEGLKDSNQSAPGMGRGHGRGTPLPASPFVPSFNRFVASGEPSQTQPGLGRGRGGVANPELARRNEGAQPPPGLGRGGGGVANLGNEAAQLQVGLGEGGVANQENGHGNERELRNTVPVFSRKDEAVDNSSIDEAVDVACSQPIGEKKLHSSIMTVLTGTGRGKPEKQIVYEEKPKEENRHLRPRRGDVRGKEKSELKEAASETKRPPLLNREEAVKKAISILTSKDDGREGGEGRGRGRGRGMGRGRGRGRRDDDDDEEEDEYDLFIGDNADGERLAKKLGPAVMAELTDALEDLSSEILPDPAEDEYIEALDTNLKIELEPEYLMGDFEANPDIYENPPLPLRDALEKMKPFLVAYEGIESQEEWEEVINETMKNVPLLKEIVDHYSGPDRVTAKQQHGELERVAKTLPATVPDAVTSFTNRAVLSLQSNPGWGFDKKWQFMDKVVNEFSQSYK